MPPEKVRLRIGNLAKAVLVTGQAYQDPKDALNEFVSNAADEYVEAGRRGERVRVVLRRRGRAPLIAIDDAGRGMTPDRLREVARNLFESGKADDARTLGEKAIGILAFQQLGGRCDVVSRAEGHEETWALRLERGKATAGLERERRRARQVPGTTVYLHDLDPDVARILTRRKVVDYLRARRGPALARGDYSIEVVEGRTAELVTPEKPDGVLVDLVARPTLLGRIEFAVHVAPPDGRRRRVAVVGRAGAVIIDDVAELDEFADGPWASDQVGGHVQFEALEQSAGRRAILRDRTAFPLFVDALQAVTPALARVVERMRREVDQDTADRLADTLRRVFSRVLRELADLDNPTRSPAGAGTGDPATPTLLAREEPPPSPAAGEAPVPRLPDGPTEPPRERERPAAAGHGADWSRTRALPSVAPDPEPTEARSRFDDVAGVVLYNERHADYLGAKDDEAALLDYLATLVAKELVLWNNPRAPGPDLAEEMVRMLVRVRRHLPRRRG
ncbi:MAG: ATP-binding protein [Thermoleophilia bacterium]|jgi:hypothetical protein|nr:ATP-binding protein [Thermoleophilia bacterium]